MKKFFRFLIVLIIIVGGCAGYFFLANNKMMVSVLKADKDALSTTLNNSIKKVHDYGNFNFTYSQDDRTTKTKTNSQILVKFDGENRYFSAEVTTIKDDKTTNTSYYCEAKGDVATLYITSGEEKKYHVTTWDLALVEAKIPLYITNVFLANDYEISKDNFVERFKSSSVTFSFKPFYYGARLEFDKDGENVKFDISNRGILRRIEATTKSLVLDQTDTLIVNKPGKAVSINSLSDEQKKAYSLF